MVKSIIFYKRQNYFLINGLIFNNELHGISNFTTGIFEDRGFESSFIDAIDGKLSSNSINHGSVDSTVSFDLNLGAAEEQAIYYRICVGEKNGIITELNNFVLENGPENLMLETENYWKNWANKKNFRFYGLSKETEKFFKRSLLLVNTHTAKNGAFISSGDSSILHLSKDTYAYMWPRDGALISRSLDRSGYSNLTESFFAFCCKALTDDGYLFHKYNPNGSLGSSWHSWIHEGHFQVPIQEDQIALVLDTLWKHYKKNKNEDYIKKIFECSVRKSANFLFHYIDKELRLPKESFDIWEEKLGIHTFTCAAVYTELIAAHNFEKIFGNKQESEKFLELANEIKKNIIKNFYDSKRDIFIKGIYHESGSIKKDMTIDSSSIYGIFEFEVLPADNEMVKSSFKLFEEKLLCAGLIGGYARYENDLYYKSHEAGRGNPWLITSLWLAEYYIAISKNENDLKKACNIFNWVQKYSLPTGILSEQLDPNSGRPLFVAPLTWGHATFIIAIDKYLQKVEELGICKTCTT